MRVDLRVEAVEAGVHAIVQNPEHHAEEVVRSQDDVGGWPALAE